MIKDKARLNDLAFAFLRKSSQGEANRRRDKVRIVRKARSANNRPPSSARPTRKQEKTQDKQIGVKRHI